MTLKEFGTFIKQKLNLEGPDELIANQFLADFPYYNRFVTQGSDKIQKLLTEPTGWFKARKSKSEAETWTNRAVAATQIQNIHLQLEAAHKGVDLATLMQMKLNTQNFEHQQELENLKAENEARLMWANSKIEMLKADHEFKLFVQKHTELRGHTLEAAKVDDAIQQRRLRRSNKQSVSKKPGEKLREVG